MKGSVAGIVVYDLRIKKNYLLHRYRSNRFSVEDYNIVMYIIYFFQFYHSLILKVTGGTHFSTLEVSFAQTIQFRKK